MAIGRTARHEVKRWGVQLLFQGIDLDVLKVATYDASLMVAQRYVSEIYRRASRRIPSHPLGSHLLVPGLGLGR